MKIKEVKSGLYYQLDPDTELEIERTNLFFNDYGEQSLPLTLPDTPRNRKITGYPTELANLTRPSTDLECVIYAGSSVINARQVVLSATAGDGIETVFYLNEGSFLSRLQKITLHEVFGKETVDGLTTVEQCKDFCLKLMNTVDERLTIFPISVDDGPYLEGENDDEYKLMLLNHFDYQNMKFVRWNQTQLKRENGTIDLPGGIYMTPFIKVNYLLKRLFGHLGYTIETNFFTQTEPFTTMCLLNTTCDTLLNGVIRYTDLLPDVTCDEFLNVMRKKFFCEFVPDETRKVVRIEFLMDVIKKTPQLDLTPYVCEPLEVEYPEEKRRVALKGKYIETTIDVPRHENLEEMKIKYPASYDDYAGSYAQSQCCYKQEIVNNIEEGCDVYRPECYVMGTVIASSAMPYDVGGNITAEEIEIDEHIAEHRDVRTGKLTGWVDWFIYSYLCAGRSRWRNSVLLEPGQSIENAKKENAGVDDASKMGIVFAFEDPDPTSGYKSGGLESGEYSLGYNGVRGIFERFYRPYDEMLRNSMFCVSATLNLPTYMIDQLKMHEPVLLKGQKMLWNSLHYKLGKTDEVKCELYTCRSYEPATFAPTFTDPYVKKPYEWETRCSYTEISAEEYNAAVHKDLMRVVVPIDREPTEELFLSQEKCYQRSWCCCYGPYYPSRYLKMDFWAVVVKNEI